LKTSEIPEPDRASRDEILLQRLISETLSKIGANLDRTSETLQRMERKLA